MKLAVSTSLGPLGAEAWTDIAQPLHTTLLIEMVLHVGPHHWGGHFGTQHIVRVATLEGKHFLRHDIGHLTNAASNEGGWL